MPDVTFSNMDNIVFQVQANSFLAVMRSTDFVFLMTKEPTFENS